MDRRRCRVVSCHLTVDLLWSLRSGYNTRFSRRVPCSDDTHSNWFPGTPGFCGHGPVADEFVQLHLS